MNKSQVTFEKSKKNALLVSATVITELFVFIFIMAL